MRTEPAMLAPRLLQHELNPYPKDNIRYVPTIEESVERLRAVTSAQVAELYHDYLGAQSGEVTIVGEFDPKACLPVLKETFSGWKAPKAYARIASPFTTETITSQHKIPTPDKANATYTSGLLFPLQDDDPQYPALVIGNYILGGGTLSSRLGNRIRQKDGLTYGVTSSFTASSEDKRGGLTITAICNPKNMTHVEQDVQEELDRLLRDGVTADELQKAKEGFLQARKVGRSSDVALAGLLNTLRHLGRTMAYEADLEKNIESLTADQIQVAIRKYFDPKKLVIVSAGDFEAKAAATVQ